MLPGRRRRVWSWIAGRHRRSRTLRAQHHPGHAQLAQAARSGSSRIRLYCHPCSHGWTHEQNEQGDLYRSGRLSVTVATPKPGKPLPSELDIAKYFNGSAPGTNITFNTADGTRLLDMQGWAMAVPNYKDGTAGVLHDKRPGDAPFYQVELRRP